MIDPRAVVDPAARLAADVEVGPFAVIGPEVEIGAGCVIGPHAVIEGPTRIGRRNRIHAFAALGGAPQDKGYGGEETRLEIGDDNVIREYVTIHRGTAAGGGVTRIGSGNFIMAYAHIAHDCQVGDGTVFANGASLAGHVVVEDHVVFGGFALVHQFCRIGRHAFLAMGCGVAKDVPPFVRVAGNPARPYGLNTPGLRRRGFAPATLEGLRRAYKVLYKEGLTLAQAQARLQAMAAELPEAGVMAAFIAGARRSIVR
ncbi:acyl-ACP--UDP-N-acetylglucosamine O-acyltransferase [Inmirania thermothiophila]|uniref:Acyl-[acyl-carrier-protein]--UDP-N-acetylglucosamine O-acyltransferase n=1 Tax=Inmirania thermothiophila TaxID=1750597 RepID=A0A3N1Y079_9GAMM|nr:acyl-ACP--UDP-N-acetylglucosamine O-acyltransferase [Inmirania thermothiophila]ROR32226.1 acyl-[acyl-carrier-protein]--UDP-N-acetylglucosamine O-acyltransferase [Inmirania thermothiophila]